MVFQILSIFASPRDLIFLEKRRYFLSSNSRARAFGFQSQFSDSGSHARLLWASLGTDGMNSSSVDEIFSCQVAFFLDNTAKVVILCS